MEDLTRRIKEGAIPLISDVADFKAYYYVIYAPDETVMAVSIFEEFAAADESNKRALARIDKRARNVCNWPKAAKLFEARHVSFWVNSRRTWRCLLGYSSAQMGPRRPKTAKSKPGNGVASPRSPHFRAGFRLVACPRRSTPKT